jgi:hypothetical protein
MNINFANVWKAVGWTDFANIPELDSCDLTIQFLCTLVEEENAISFRLFSEEFSISWKDLTTLLGFHHRCTLDVEKATRGFEKQSFWQSISGETTLGKPRCNDIQNPALCLMHKWVAITCFPRDVRPTRVDKLWILFAMVNKIKISPVKFMIR